jgi:histidinol-phosphate phosphatase family protein
MRAVFLDRDGTIIEDRHFLSTPLGVRFKKGVLEGLRLLRKHGFKLFVITNQSGVGRGYFSLERVEVINREIDLRLRAHGIFLSGFYICPHHPREGCNCRKPRGGLILRVLKDYPDLEIKSSFVIGDKIRDIEIGDLFGMKKVLISEKPVQVGADYIARDLLDAARFIVVEHDK